MDTKVKTLPRPSVLNTSNYHLSLNHECGHICIVIIAMLRHAIAAEAPFPCLKYIKVKLLGNMHRL